MKTAIRSANSKARVVLYRWVRNVSKDDRRRMKQLTEDFEQESKRYGWVVVDSIMDVGVGDMMSKPGISKLLGLVRDDKVDGVYVSCFFDDLSPYMSEILMFHKTLVENGVELIEQGVGVDLEDEEDKKYLLEVNAFWSQYSHKSDFLKSRV